MIALQPVRGVVGDVHAPAANTAAVVTYAADPNFAHVLHAIHVSYSAAPTGGNLKVEDASGNVIWQVDVTAAGPQAFVFLSPKRGRVNQAMIVTLAAAGASVSGKVSCTHSVE